MHIDGNHIWIGTKSPGKLADGLEMRSLGRAPAIDMPYLADIARHAAHTPGEVLGRDKMRMRIPPTLLAIDISA